MKRLMTVQGLADYCVVSRRQAERWLRTGIPGVPILRLGRSVRVRAVDVENWVAAGCPGLVDDPATAPAEPAQGLLFDDLVDADGSVRADDPAPDAREVSGDDDATA